MLLRVLVCSVGPERLAHTALNRYTLLNRFLRAFAERDQRVLAFGLQDDALRLVVEGCPRRAALAARVAKAATSRTRRAEGVEVRWESTEIAEIPAEALEEAVGWAHRVDLQGGTQDPLCTPWTSHRDLLGYRRADFFDPTAARARVDVARVHALAGGGALPADWPPAAPRREALTELMRVAAAVCGLLPADRRSFAVFAQLARACGWRTLPIAQALGLTTRRVRQLAAEPDPMVELALRTLSDPRLAIVP